jgi:CO/xanthine dehydrogenase Mo-binding subunit
MEYRVVGRPVPRKEARAKVTGSAEYVDDVSLPGMLHGVTVRSSIPRGVIREIIFDDGVPWDEFVIATASDIPGRNIVSLIVDDQPYLASTAVNHAQEPVLLLAHADKQMAIRGREHVRIVYDALPPVLTMDEALAANTVIAGTDNVFKRYEIKKGDVDSVWQTAAHIIKGEYSTGAQEQL